jgi:hypothetical protein
MQLSLNAFVCSIPAPHHAFSFISAPAVLDAVWDGNNSIYIYCIYVCMYIYIYIYAYIHTYIHTYTHTYIHTYVRTYIIVEGRHCHNTHIKCHTQPITSEYFCTILQVVASWPLRATCRSISRCWGGREHSDIYYTHIIYVCIIFTLSMYTYNHMPQHQQVLVRPLCITTLLPGLLGTLHTYIQKYIRTTYLNTYIHT